MKEHAAYDHKPDGYFHMYRPEMLGYLPTTARRILDVGCSAGTFGEGIKQQRKDVEVWGIEPHEPSVVEAAKRLDKAIHGYFDERVQLPEKHFDAIVFNDVLEHTPEPEKLLKLATRYLTPNGVVVASIPNFRHFRTFWNLVAHRWAAYEDFGIMDRTHLRIFTKSSIEILFNDAGYSIDRIEGTNGQFIDWKYYVVTLCTLGRFADTKWLQYAVVARPRAT